MSFRDRLKRLEEDAGGGRFLVIRLTGGLPNTPVPTPEEERVLIACARAEGKSFVVIGGLG